MVSVERLSPIMARNQLSRRERAQGTKRQSRKPQLMWPQAGPSYLEHYAFDSSFANTPSAAGVIQSGLAAIPSGAGAGTRQGLRVTPISLQARMSIIGSDKMQSVSDADFQSCRVRVLLIQSLYNTPAVGDVLGGPSINVLSPYNLSFVGQQKEDSQIKVLFDRTYNLTKYQASAHDIIDVSSSNFLTKQLRFSGAATADPVHGAFYMITITDQTLAAEFPLVTYFPRVLYTDA